MKMLRYSFIFLFIAILLVPSQGVVATSVSDFKSLTWSDEIEKDATYSWKVNTLSLNDTPINNPETYGFIDGAVIQIKVLVQLSDVDLMDFVEDTIELPDPADYVEISVNGVEVNFKLYNAVIFIVPSVVTITEGETNAFYVLESSDIVVFSADNDVNPVSGEYVEFDDSANSEEFVWDLNTGLLKSVKINYTNGFQFDMTSVATSNVTLDETPISSLWIISSVFVAVFIIRKRN